MWDDKTTIDDGDRIFPIAGDADEMEEPDVVRDEWAAAADVAADSVNPEALVAAAVHSAAWVFERPAELHSTFPLALAEALSVLAVPFAEHEPVEREQ